MISYGLSIKVDTASPFAARIRSALAERRFRAPIAEAGKMVTMRHFRDKEANANTHATANRLGARPTGLFADFAQATSATATETGAVVSINHPAIRQRIQGGEIKPVNSTYLTIPARAEAYGKSAKEMSVQLKYGLALDPETKRWRKALVADVFAAKGKVAGAYFWLVRKVKQKPDPTVLPDDEHYFKEIDEAVGDWIEGLL